MKWEVNEPHFGIIHIQEAGLRRGRARTRQIAMLFIPDDPTDGEYQAVLRTASEIVEAHNAKEPLT